MTFASLCSVIKKFLTVNTVPSGAPAKSKATLRFPSNPTQPVKAITLFPLCNGNIFSVKNVPSSPSFCGLTVAPTPSTLELITTEKS